MYDVFDFITKLMQLYPQSFTEANKSHWYDAYKEAVGNTRTDFEKLMKLVLLEHKSQSFAPAPEFIAEKARQCRIRTTDEKPQWRDVWVLDPTLANEYHPEGCKNLFCVPYNTTDEAVLAALKSKFPTSEGWKIIGKYDEVPTVQKEIKSLGALNRKIASLF